MSVLFFERKLKFTFEALMFSEYVVLPSHCGHLIEWCMLYASTPKVLLCEGSTVSCRCPFRGLMLLRGMFLLLCSIIYFIYIFTHIYIYINMGVVQKYGAQKLPLRCPFRALSRASRIGTRDFFQVFVSLWVYK